MTAPHAGERPPKLTPDEISKRLSFENVSDFKKRAHMVPSCDPEDFIIMAFPEWAK